jgi:hypothetical protein
MTADGATVRGLVDFSGTVITNGASGFKICTNMVSNGATLVFGRGPSSLTAEPNAVFAGSIVYVNGEGVLREIYSSITVSSMVVTAQSTWTRGNTITVGTLSASGGTFIATNGSVYAKTIIARGGAISAGASTIYLLGGTSNLTNYYSLVPVGAVTLTGAVIRVTGTLTSQSGASLNAAGGTLTLSNPGLVDGNLQSATVTGNVLRVDGIADKSSGQLNTPRMGRR